MSFHRLLLKSRLWIAASLVAVMVILAGCGGGGSQIPTTTEIVSITSTSSTSLQITFTTEMGESAAVKENYDITHTSDAGFVTRLIVAEASLSANAKQVTLTTLTQAQIAYTVKISNVTDAKGTALDVSKNNTFVGTVGTGSGADLDADGLSDAQEQKGWSINVRNGDKVVETYTETSDPTVGDTDGDGLSDGEEFIASLDARKPDTDGDGLNDLVETNTFKTDADNRDIDADGLSDGDEINQHKTSPRLDDTDGDGLSDSKEIDTKSNPLLADLPQIQIDVGQVSLKLDVRFQSSRGTAVTDSQEKSASTTLEESQSEVRGTSDSTTDEFFAEISATAGFEVGTDGANVSGSFTASGGLGGSNSFSVSNESATASSKAFEETLSTSVTSEVNETITRTVEGASMIVKVKIENVKNIPVRIAGLEINVAYKDPANPLNLELLGVIKRAQDDQIELDAGASKEFTYTVTSGNDGGNLFPAEVEKLMQNPQGIVFSVADFSLVGVDDQSFFNIRAKVRERTAPLYIDYGLAGNGRFDRNLVATFDPATGDRSISVAEALETILGLKHFDEDSNPTSSLSASERETSYSTRRIGDTEVIWRIRGVARDATVGAKQEWVILLSTGINRQINIREFRLEPLNAGSTDLNNSVTLAFVEDLDKDGVPDRLEYAEGSSFEADSGVNNLDSDGDGVSCEGTPTRSGDACETFENRTIEIIDIVGEAGDTTPKIRKVRSSPARADSDGDGLSDAEEITLGTDPSRADTDGDRVLDAEEVRGWTPGGFITNPLDVDTDNDGISDGDEKALGSNPTVKDADAFTDSDRDGLTDSVEKAGWLITVTTCETPTRCTTPPITKRVFSDPNDPDSDDDGLPDNLEFGKTDPTLKDTDGDGYNDNDERDPDLARADTDGDGLSDFFEKETGWTVRVEGEVAKTVKSDPTKIDTDGDGLTDRRELDAGTDPNLVDTDGDGSSDLVEFNRNINARFDDDTNPRAKDQLIVLTYTELVLPDDCSFGSDFWMWNLGASLPNGTFPTMVVQGKGRETEDPQPINLLIDASKLDNPITFVKKHSQEFKLQGFVFEIDEGARYDIKESTPNAIVSGVVAFNTVSRDLKLTSVNCPSPRDVVISYTIRARSD